MFIRSDLLWEGHVPRVVFSHAEGPGTQAVGLSHRTRRPSHEADGRPRAHALRQADGGEGVSEGQGHSPSGLRAVASRPGGQEDG